MNIREALGWTLIHSLWQGAAIAVLLAVAWRVARSWSAAARYGLCAVALIVLGLLPVFTLALLLSPPGESGASFRVMNTLATRAMSAVAFTGAPFTAGAETWRERLDSAVPWITALWCAGVILLSFRRIGGWIWLVRSRRTWQAAPIDWVAQLRTVSSRLGIQRLPNLCLTARAISPCVIGWIRPVILVPAAALTGWSAEEFAALLAHELAHIRRHDYLVNLAQTVVETLYFYHPVVWWVSRQMRIEREHCCDDLAVGVLGDRVGYARVLVDLAGRRAAADFALAASGGSLSTRVRRLLTGEMVSGRPPIWPAVALALGVCAILVAADRRQPATAFETAQAAEAPAPPAADASPLPDLAPAPPAAAVDDQTPAAAPPPEPPSAGPVNEEFLSGIIHSGLRNVTIDDLIQMRIRGVTPELARQVLRIYVNATVKDLCDLTTHGITASYIEAMRAGVAGNLDIGDLMRLRIHGVSAEYVAEMNSLLNEKLGGDDLVRMRIHGVDADFARRIKKEFPNATVEQLIRMRIAGL
jgi:beta-lactamase regulating signal transducer with metallopeptidase domain